MPSPNYSEWFQFSKKQRNGTFMLLGLIILMIVWQNVQDYFFQSKKYDHTAFEQELASLKVKSPDSMRHFKQYSEDDDHPFQPYTQPHQKRYGQEEWNGTLFIFDPNTLDEAGWQKLGVREKTVRTIKNFISKGGRFYQADDIKKIWGLDESLAERLIPFIRIAKTAYVTTQKSTFEKKTYTPTLVDINVADTNALIALPGIGAKLAQRIITFRDRLGGFYSIAQLGETYGLADSTFQKIKPRLTILNEALRQFNINTATVDDMKSHPYIRFNIANAIVQYRNQHGKFATINELKKVVIITDDVFNKMQPYLKAD